MMQRSSIGVTLALGVLGVAALGLSRAQDRSPPTQPPAQPPTQPPVQPPADAPKGAPGEPTPPPPATTTAPSTVPATPANVVRAVRLDLDFPAVGNVDGVRQWRFGRVERVDAIANDPDIWVTFRTGDGNSIRVRSPAAPLDDLARQSNWLTSPDKSMPGRSDYVERMVAFDVDNDGRLIAVASLEPTSRNRNRLRSALGR